MDTPDRQTFGISICLLRNDTWKQAEYIKKGSYLLFDMEGTEKTFIITHAEKNIVKMIWIILTASAVIAAFLWVRGRGRTHLIGNVHKILKKRA